MHALLYTYACHNILRLLTLILPIFSITTTNWQRLFYKHLMRTRHNTYNSNTLVAQNITIVTKLIGFISDFAKQAAGEDEVIEKVAETHN